MATSASEYRRRRQVRLGTEDLPDHSATAMPRYQTRRAKAHRVYERRMEKWVPLLKPS